MIIKEITTYDGRQTRTRSQYDSRPTVEVKIGKLYHCTNCGEYLSEIGNHTSICNQKISKSEINNQEKILKQGE